ncbi:beta-klotho isoform X2 [Petromyzon marinus]|uniref:beta-klotho isoform X2 n=1 Tax=Petromyzon marinus TaxID=7757 RepID=UPI003F6E9D8E
MLADGTMTTSNIAPLVCLFLLLHQPHHRRVHAKPGNGMKAWEKFSSGSTTSPPADEARFPEGFSWSVGTAAYQVEGAWDADGKAASIWDKFTHGHPEMFDGSSGDVASDGYHHAEEDVEALRWLGVSHYKFSISWPRLLPNGSASEPSAAGLRFYNETIDLLVRAGIRPVVTLYHWDLPQALQERHGGWLSEATVDAFAEYAEFCFRAFGDRVRTWFTVHNPYAVAWHGYGSGTHAPGIRDPGLSPYVVAHNLIKAHARAYRIYQRHFKPTQGGEVSLVLGSHWVEPRGGSHSPNAAAGDGGTSASNIVACQRSLDSALGWFARPIFHDGDYPASMRNELGARLPTFSLSERDEVRGSADFFALAFGPTNFERLEAARRAGQEAALRLRPLLSWVSLEYDRPRIVLAESGWFSDGDGGTRDTANMYMLKSFLNDALRAVREDGVRLEGFTAWSLLDGFEWGHGFRLRRGLMHVDFTSPGRARRPKSSARLYRQVIARNGFPEPEPPVYGTFPSTFSWGVTEGIVEVEESPSSVQFADTSVYRWDVHHSGKLLQLPGLRMQPRLSQCTDFTSIRSTVSLLRRTGVTAYRFSLSWSLLLPSGDPGRPNHAALRYYRCLATELRHHAIEPVVTLYHPSHRHVGLPRVLNDAGGWLNVSAVEAFAAYARLCFGELGGAVRTWLTMNEPSTAAHAEGSPGSAYARAHNLIRAHARAWRVYDVEFRAEQGGQVSLALRADWYQAADPFAGVDAAATAERAMLFDLGWFAEPIFGTGDYPQEVSSWIAHRRQLNLTESRVPSFTEEEKAAVRGAYDFIALNHFTTRLVLHDEKPGSSQALDRAVNIIKDMTWLRSAGGLAVAPWGLRAVLGWVARRYGARGAAILVTANGVDDRAPSDDRLRVLYHQRYINEMLKAYRLDGVRVGGYFAWTLRDKVAPLSGLYASPYYDTAAKASLGRYRATIAANGFPEPTGVGEIDDDDGATSPGGTPQAGTVCPACLFFRAKGHVVFFSSCLLSSALLLVIFCVYRLCCVKGVQDQHCFLVGTLK